MSKTLIDEMTPEMMRKVQMHSELGAYAASNLVGAYDLFQEFWRVAMSAAPQPAPVQEPVAFFDWYDNAHWGNEDLKECCHRSWNAAIKYTTPPAAQQPDVDAMIALVRADEREACAKVCDAVARQMDDEGEGPTGNIGWVSGCAAAIRARGNT
jgi:hypothetical protein